MTETAESDWYARMSRAEAEAQSAARVASTRHRAIAAALQAAARDYQGDPDESPHPVDPFYLAAAEYVAAVDEAQRGRGPAGDPGTPLPFPRPAETEAAR